MGIRLFLPVLRAVGIILAVLATTAAAPAAAPASNAPPAAWQVYEILHHSCVECHGGHLAKPKGKLGYILDLARLAEEGYVLPGQADDSDLYRFLVSTDDEEKMPPPDSEGPRPTTAEIELIRAWIAAGAIATNRPPNGDSASADAADTSARGSRPLGQKLGRLHPLVIHFPIALLLCACGTEVLSRLLRRHAGWLQGTTRGTLWIAATGAITAALFGWLNAAFEGFASAEVDTHRWLGISTAVLSLLTLIASEAAERARARDVTRGARRVLLALLVIAAVIVTLAGHTGGLLAYGKDYLGLW